MTSLIHHFLGFALISTITTFPTAIDAATVLNSVYSVETNMEGVIDNDTGVGNQGFISSSQLMEFNNNHSGPIRATAAHMTRTDNHAGDGTFSFSADSLFGRADANIISQTSSSERARIHSGSNATFTVTFELGIGEVKQANLTLDYTIAISNGNQNSAAVEWILTAPDTSVVGISSSDTRSADINEIVNTGEMSAILDQSGIYSLTISSDIPYQAFNNHQHSASATLDAVYFEVVNIPEPSSATLLGLALGSCISRRSRQRF